GVLFPFGHRATYVDTYTGEFSGDAAPVAALQVSRILVITEPVRDEYNIAERQFPFQSVEICSGLVTGLDQPSDVTTFWPKQGGAPVMFSVRARAAEHVIDMSLPLLFHADAPGGPPVSLADKYAQGPQGGGEPTADVGRLMPLAMKSKTEALRDSVQQVKSLTLGGKSVAG